MPCTLQPWEIEHEEKSINKDRFGMSMTDERLLEEVACQACRLLRQHDLLQKASPLLQKWATIHIKKDKLAGR